jgi:hypothetical protein
MMPPAAPGAIRGEKQDRLCDLVDACSIRRGITPEIDAVATRRRCWWWRNRF